MYSPSLEEFIKLSSQGNLVPVSRRLLADIETPLSAYRKIRGADESFLFESVEGGEHLQTPVMYFLIADQLLIFDRVAQTITVLVNAVLDDAASPQEAYENAVAEIERLVALLEQPSEHHPATVPDEVPSIPFESNLP